LVSHYLDSSCTSPARPLARRKIRAAIAALALSSRSFLSHAIKMAVCLISMLMGKS
jgi:hypothetical protein